MLKLSLIEQTMLFTLRPRAEEHHRPDQLFRDPEAVSWFEQAGWPAEYEKAYDAKMQNGIAIRVKTVDDVVERFMATHTKPLIIELGAGLSTRTSRLNLDPNRWFAIDLPAALEFRKKFANKEAPSQQIAGSILETDWFNQLPSVPSESVLFVTEGLLSFFRQDQLATMVKQLKTHFPSATLVGDVMGESNRTKAGKRLEAIGAPAHWFITDEQDIAALGMSLVNVWPIITQYPQRWEESMAQWAQDPALRNSSLVFEARI